MSTFIEIVIGIGSLILIVIIPMGIYLFFISKFKNLFEKIILEKLPKFAKFIGSVSIFILLSYLTSELLNKYLSYTYQQEIVIFFGSIFLYWLMRNDAFKIRYKKGIEHFFKKSIKELQGSNNLFYKEIKTILIDDEVSSLTNNQLDKIIAKLILFLSEEPLYRDSHEHYFSDEENKKSRESLYEELENYLSKNYKLNTDTLSSVIRERLRMRI